MAADAIKCPTCGLEEAFADDGERPPPLHEVGEFRCDGCGARYVYGQLTPCVVVEPHRNEATGFMWTRIRFQDPATRADVHVADLDPKLAASLAKNILSLVIR
jgi:hypothetical protein